MKKIVLTFLLITIMSCSFCSISNAEETTTFSADSSLNANKPQLSEGMIPVKHNGINWVITNIYDEEWYDYNYTKMKWANVMLRDEAKYLDLDGKTLKDVGNIPLDDLIGREIPEDSTGSMYVWIPRYTYKIENNNINIKYSRGIVDYVSGEYEGYKTHAAFNYTNYIGGNAYDDDSYTSIQNSDKYLGLWIAKYPAGGNILSPKYASNVSPITNASIGDSFTASKLTSELSTYGVSNVDSHMMKNTEWGAVAYFATAVGNLGNDSTTSNIYGIYGMDTGTEYVANFIELIGGISNFSVRKNGRSLIPYNMIRYNYTKVAELKDIDILKLKSTVDSQESNFNRLASFYGVGINEVDASITGNITKDMPYGEKAFFARGMDGIYSYVGTDGASNNNIGFRNVILGLDRNTTNNSQAYIINATAAPGGSISPAGNTTVEGGKNITYSIIPEAGQEIVDVLIDGLSSLDALTNNGTYYTYTFYNVNSNHSISVIFDVVVSPYEVVVIKSPEEAGIIEGAGTHNSRSTVTLRANNANGYRFTNWEVVENLDSIFDNTSNETSFKMPNANVTLRANFEKILKAILLVEGMDTRAKGEEDVGAPINVSASSKEGFVFSKWAYDGIELTEEQVKSETITISMPSNDVTLIAEYNKLYEVRTILEDGTTTIVEYPETKEVTLNAPENSGGKQFVSWEIYGVTSWEDNGTTVTFTMPSNEVTVIANYQ